MKSRFLCVLAASLLVAASLSAKCIPFEDAPNNIGKERCVKGKVVKVAETRSGNWYLNFCQDYRNCAFSVVVFQRDLAEVGDVHKLEGKEIRVFGRIHEYQGRTEMVLSRSQQLTGEPPTEVPEQPSGRRPRPRRR